MTLAQRLVIFIACLVVAPLCFLVGIGMNSGFMTIVAPVVIIFIGIFVLVSKPKVN